MYNTRTLLIQLFKNQICPIQLVNDWDIAATVTITTSNKANITMKRTGNSRIYFSDSGDFEMTQYAYATNY